VLLCQEQSSGYAGTITCCAYAAFVLLAGRGLFSRLKAVHPLDHIRSCRCSTCSVTRQAH
jgi:hypothetical protein